MSTTITTTTTTITTTTTPSPAIAISRPYTASTRRTRAFARQLWQETPPPDDWHTIPRELQIARIRLASRVLAVSLSDQRRHAFELDLFHIFAATVIQLPMSRMLVVEYADLDAPTGSSARMPRHALVHWDDALRVIAWLARQCRSGSIAPPTSRDALRQWIAFDMPGGEPKQPEPTSFTLPDDPAAFYRGKVPLGPLYYNGTVWPPTPELTSY